ARGIDRRPGVMQHDGAWSVLGRLDANGNREFVRAIEVTELRKLKPRFAVQFHGTSVGAIDGFRVFLRLGVFLKSPGIGDTLASECSEFVPRETARDREPLWFRPLPLIEPCTLALSQPGLFCFLRRDLRRQVGESFVLLGS